MKAAWAKRAAIAAGVVAGISLLDWLMETPISGRTLVNKYQYVILVSAAVNVVLAVSLQLINGVTGQFSIGHAGFMAVGAYGAGSFSFFVGEKMSKAIGDPFGVPIAFAIALLIGMLLAAIA